MEYSAYIKLHLMSRETVIDIMNAFGYIFDSKNNYRMFSIRDGEKTPSASIKQRSNDCLITDFSGYFQGDLIGLIMLKDGKTFFESLNKIAEYLNLDKYKEFKQKQGNNDAFYKQPKPPTIKQEPKEVISNIKFSYPDYSKKYENGNGRLIQELSEFNKKNDSEKYQIILSYIYTFSQKNKDEEKIKAFFKSRGLPFSVAKEVGFLGQDNISRLTQNLKDIFGVETLSKLGILSEKGYWKHGIRDKISEKFSYTDALVYSMHSPYSNLPTNLEFRFIGDVVKNSNNKTSSIENNQLVQPNYQGDTSIDNLVEHNQFFICEGATDQKTLEAYGYNALSLIGVAKHYNENLGNFRDKDIIICFDKDTAGDRMIDVFAEKLYNAGIKHIFLADWKPEYGKDINELHCSGNMNKIEFSLLERDTKVENNIIIPFYKKVGSPQPIDNEFIKKMKEEIDTLIHPVNNQITNQNTDNKDYSSSGIEATNYHR